MNPCLLYSRIDEVDVLFFDDYIPTVVLRPLRNTEDGNVPRSMNSTELKVEAITFTWAGSIEVDSQGEVSSCKLTLPFDTPSLDSFIDTVLPFVEGFKTVTGSGPVCEVRASDDQISRIRKSRQGGIILVKFPDASRWSFPIFT